jgi:hypothetical protein
MHRRPAPRREMEEGRKARRAAIVAVLALLVLLALLLRPARQRGEAHAEGADPESSSDTPREGLSNGSPAPQARAPDPPSSRSVDPPPVIDEIVLEKPEVCAGEENLVTVHAHTLDGTDEFLHYVVDGNMGYAVPLRLWLDRDGRVEGTHFISVFGRTNAATTVPLPEYKVKDCPPTRMAALEQRLRANSWGDFDFVARVVTLPPPDGRPRPGAERSFVPTSYGWSFGDGDMATTSGPVVSHSYERRRQTTLYSYFIVGVQIRGEDGATLSARTTLPLINSAFESLARKGIVQLLIALDPRFPELGNDGRVVQHVHLWHTRPDPVRIENAAVTEYFETGSGETRPRAVDVAGLLGATSIPPGKEGITTTVVLDTLADPGVFSATYRLVGKSQDGHPVMGSFSVMRPPPRPTSESSEPITDPALRRRILAAREALGKEVVNDEDLWRLEREGRLPTAADPPGPLEKREASGH